MHCVSTPASARLAPLGRRQRGEARDRVELAHRGVERLQALARDRAFAPTHGRSARARPRAPPPRAHSIGASVTWPPSPCSGQRPGASPRSKPETPRPVPGPIKPSGARRGRRRHRAVAVRRREIGQRERERGEVVDDDEALEAECLLTPRSRTPSGIGHLDVVAGDRVRDADRTPRRRGAPEAAQVGAIASASDRVVGRELRARDVAQRRAGVVLPGKARVRAADVAEQAGPTRERRRSSPGQPLNAAQRRG